MLNNVVLIGRLTKDPELRYVSNSTTAVCEFTLAVDRPVAKGEEKQADFIPIICWRQLAETCANYLRKGRLCALTGRMQVRNYEKDGRRIYVTEVIADNVRFLERADTSNNQSAAADILGGTEIDIDDDDLPF